MQAREKIHDVMHSTVFTCRPTDSLETAARVMRDHDCGVVPVADEQEHLVGILTDRDIALAALEQQTRLKDIRVQEVMTANVISVHPNDDIQEAERRMSRNQVRRVPVVSDDDRVVGIVALADLALHADKSNTRHDLNRDAVGAVLTAISEPPGHEHGRHASR